MNIKFKIIILFLAILGIEMIIPYALPNWTLRYRILLYINYIITSISFFGIFFLIILFIKDKIISVILNIFISILFLLSCFITIQPIDVYGDPVDVKILNQLNDGKKIVVTKRVHAKPNPPKYDTLIVRDILIFREIFKH